MHSTNYRSTLIRPAPDCRAQSAKVPAKPDSVAGRQYALMADAPYRLTSDDVLSQVAGERKCVRADAYDGFRAEFFSRGQPCFRASPLTKTHGWAVHSDEQGRIALIDPASARFEALQSDPDITVLDAMRNKRA